jgi:hypothetical protein
MLFTINNTLLGKLFINNNKQIFNYLDKIANYKEISISNNWQLQLLLKYNNNILMSNILLQNNKTNTLYDELLYKDMSNCFTLLNNDSHVILKNNKEINISKINNKFYDNFNKEKKIINSQIYLSL